MGVLNIKAFGRSCQWLWPRSFHCCLSLRSSSLWNEWSRVPWSSRRGGLLQAGGRLGATLAELVFMRMTCVQVCSCHPMLRPSSLPGDTVVAVVLVLNFIRRRVRVEMLLALESGIPTQLWQWAQASPACESLCSSVKWNGLCPSHKSDRRIRRHLCLNVNSVDGPW